MTISSVGFDGTMTEAGWARLASAIGYMGNKHGVVSGLAVTPGAGTRQTSVASGEVLLPGINAVSDATVTLTHAANASGSARTDLVVAEADWSTNDVTIKVVQGSSATTPALTQTMGVLWQTPLKRVSVPASYAAAFNSTHLFDAAPVRLPATPIRATVDLTQTVAFNAAGPATIATVSVPDPGRAYYLRIVGQVQFEQKGSGYVNLSAQIAGSTVERARTAPLADGDTFAQLVGRPSLVLTGAQTVTVVIESLGMSSGTVTMPTGGANVMNHLTVEQIPV